MTETHSGSGARVWSDEDFLRAFEDLSFPAEQFHHREHLRVAWLYLRSSDATRAAERICAGIRRFANHHGATGKIHHTLTLFWMRMVGIALVETAEDGGFVEFLAEHPELCGKNLPATYYSQDLLQTGAAREGWVEPDLQPLPNLRVYRCC